MIKYKTGGALFLVLMAGYSFDSMVKIYYEPKIAVLGALLAFIVVILTACYKTANYIFTTNTTNNTIS